MEELKVCPICQTPVFNIADVDTEPVYGCDNCKRQWLNHDGMWVSKARPVKLKREPRINDSLDDFLEPI
jgi:endogenous inhibitor of DNA gyrase (YacG/DUF329 family)